MILHIPHSSTHIPKEYLDDYLLSAQDLQQEILTMTDHYTDELFDWPCDRAVFPVSRLLVDVERFEDDVQEPMAERGMGVLYEKTSELKPLRKALSTKRREELLSKYYRPHHKKLEMMVEYRLCKSEKALVIDCHSFNELARPYERYTGGQRADICLGTDSFHTPKELIELMKDFFTDRGYSLAVDDPFVGCLIPMKFYGKDKRVQGIMIELNRKLYMDESTGKKHPGFDKLKNDLENLRELLMFL